MKIHCGPGEGGACFSVPDIPQEEKTRVGRYKKNKQAVRLERGEVLRMGGKQKKGKTGE